ncbi:hypothetical protein ACLOJK_020293 [Asimina triloba]
MVVQSLWCITFTHKQITNVGANSCDHKLPEDGLTLLGMVGLMHPCRPGVKTVVDACKRAGVTVKMITGDNLHIARAIALECSILRADLAFNEVGQVIAVTKDGTNDAPALKESDIGLSMGIHGTKVAKESSDIVILDNNFTSVVTILQWGRCVYKNTQKFIQFHLKVNVATLVINFIAVVLSGDVPFTTVQLLWVKLIIDTLGVVALTTEFNAIFSAFFGFSEFNAMKLENSFQHSLVS